MAQLSVDEHPLSMQFLKISLEELLSLKLPGKGRGVLENLTNPNNRSKRLETIRNFAN